MNKNEIILYQSLLEDIKKRIRQGQTKAILAANSELITMYWDIGKMILLRQQNEGWGTHIIRNLVIDMKNEIAEIKGFSERNIGYMLNFAKEYSFFDDKNIKFPILQQPVAKLETLQNTDALNHLLNQIPWGHHILLLEKVKDISIRFWYMNQTIEQGWTREILKAMVESNTYLRQQNIVSNFEQKLPEQQFQLVKQTLKDPYIFDFLTLTDTFTERELELELVKHLEIFLIELGTGFAFVGRQYKIVVAERDYYFDLLFYHLKLRCFIVIDLKKGDFKPEYAGKMNFYCNVADDIIRHHSDEPTIGLILCQSKDKVMAEYALRNMNTPIGVSEYELTRALPERLKSSLPSIEDIETAFNEA